MTARTTLILVALAALAGTASAQRMAPGLWEHTMTMKGGGAEAAMAGMQQQLATMPPEQRKQVEQMMAQQGMGMGMGGAPNAMRVCISPAMADKPEMPQNEKGCQQESLQRSGSTLRYKFRCDGPPARSGEGEFTLQGDKAYSGRATVTTTERQGQPERMEMTMTGRFVGADCGALKPAR